MTEVAPHPDIHERYEALADKLETKGVFADTDWRRVFLAVPRWEFLPARTWAESDDDPDRYIPDSVDDDDGYWWDAALGDRIVYLRVAHCREVVTSESETERRFRWVPHGPPIEWATGTWGYVPISSASQPSEVFRMLGWLDVRPGHQILEIGTGSGWNAALLAERVGSAGRVTTMDLDPELTYAAQKRLKAHGYEVFVVLGDGHNGCPSSVKYDRIICTCSVEKVPDPWLEQLAEGGVIVAPVGDGYGSERYTRVYADGRVEDLGEASFMPARHP